MPSYRVEGELFIGDDGKTLIKWTEYEIPDPVYACRYCGREYPSFIPASRCPATCLRDEPPLLGAD